MSCIFRTKSYSGFCEQSSVPIYFKYIDTVIHIQKYVIYIISCVILFLVSTLLHQHFPTDQSPRSDIRATGWYHYQYANGMLLFIDILLHTFLFRLNWNLKWPRIIYLKNSFDKKRHTVFPVTTYNFCCLLIIVIEKDQCITFYNYFCRRQSCSFTVENFISIYSRNHVKLTSDYLELNLAKNERWIIVEKKVEIW
jgi:hypothetical protein